MPAQKRSAHSMDNEEAEAEAEAQVSSSPSPPQPQPQHQPSHHEHKTNNDSEGSPASSVDKDEFVLVKLSDIRKEVQCPICLGIIRKTRTVMECLHRFCRECIDKSMRLGNNECPACRTHCASRRSLRDDPNYDTLIAILYPDIDKYEEEELAFHEEEKNRNKQIQASIAQTLQRQSEALGRRRITATVPVFVRRSQGSYRNLHGHNGYLRGKNRIRRDSGARSDDDVDDANGNDGGQDSSSADEPSPEVKQRRRRRCSSRRFSSSTSADGGHDENDDAGIVRDSVTASPLIAGTSEVLAWGRGGTRSHTRYGSLSGSNGKNSRNSRLAKLLDHLRNSDENENETDVHLTLLPLDKQEIPSLERPYLCCRPSLSIRHLCQLISLQIPMQADDLEILAKNPKCPDAGTAQGHATSDDNTAAQSKHEVVQDDAEMHILSGEETLALLRPSAASSQGELVLVYRPKLPS